MIKVLHPDGRADELTLPALSLERAQEFVGGYVEIVKLVDGDLIVNEEGLLERKPLNAAASKLAGFAIVGTAIHVTRPHVWK